MIHILLCSWKGIPWKISSLSFFSTHSNRWDYSCRLHSFKVFSNRPPPLTFMPLQPSNVITSSCHWRTQNVIGFIRWHSSSFIGMADGRIRHTSGCHDFLVRAEVTLDLLTLRLQTLLHKHVFFSAVVHDFLRIPPADQLGSGLWVRGSIKVN